jgi:hypothetical protein
MADVLFDKLVDDFDINDLTHTPTLVDFLNVLNRSANTNLFIKERDRVKGSKQRVSIPSIVSLISTFYYDILLDKHDSDVMCLRRLLASQELVNEGNYIPILKSLSILCDKVLFTNDQMAIESNHRSQFLDAIASHEWFTDGKRCIVKSSKIFVMGEDRALRLSSDRSSNMLASLEDVIEITDHTVYEVAFKLMKIIDDPSHLYWIHAAVQFVQLTVGSRWIEAILLSKFELSGVPQFDIDTNIVVRGLAKDGNKVKSKLCSQLKVAGKSGNHEEYERLVGVTSDELQDGKVESTIVKPVLQINGATPKYIVGLVKLIRERVDKEFGRLVTRADQFEVTKRFKQPTYRLFAMLWSPANVARFKNKTHIFRKIYASLTNRLYNGSNNLNLWIMKVLSHDSLSTSFAYANVVVVPSPELQDMSIQEKVDHLKQTYLDITKSQSAMSKQMLVILKGNKALMDMVTILSDQVKHHITSDIIELHTNDHKIVKFKKYETSFFLKRYRNVDEKARFVESRMSRVITDFDVNNVDVTSLTLPIMLSLGITRFYARNILKQLRGEL